MHTYEMLLVTHTEEIATITINNPSRANVLSKQTIRELTHAIDAIALDETVRAVIITGAGERVFVGGADIRELHELTATTARLFIRELHTLIEKIRRLEKPVIAAVNGVCLGAGLELVVGCDIIIAAETALFGMPEIEIGIPSVIEGALLLNLLGALRTKEFLFTGDRWDAARAEGYGLVNYVVPAHELLPRAQAMCQRINRHSPTALALQKDLVNRWMTTDLDTAIEYGINALGIAFTTGDSQEAMQAFQEKRSPHFPWQH
ncbi:MAG: enoyl-CoA hydratase-related protein [Ktedonobacteraceae bacterium]